MSASLLKSLTQSQY